MHHIGRVKLSLPKHHKVNIHKFERIWLALVLDGLEHVLVRHNIYPEPVIAYFTDIPTSNIRRTWLGNKIGDHLDVVGASPVKLLQLHLRSRLNIWLQWIGQRQLPDEMRIIQVLEFGATYIRHLTVVMSLPFSHNHYRFYFIIVHVLWCWSYHSYFFTHILYFTILFVFEYYSCHFIALLWASAVI